MSDSGFAPVAPPPAAPPPPPPPSPPQDRGAGSGTRGLFSGPSDSKPTVVRSYQRGESLVEADRPTIEHYGDEDGGNGEPSWLASSLRALMPGPDGDVNVNTGVANSAEGSGTTLPELVVRMRIVNITLCTLAIAFEIPSLIGKAIMNPPRAVLSAYLVCFAGTLCCFEMHIPSIARFIRDKLGLLYSPTGRSFFLFLMGGLCFGQGNMFEFVLGCVMVANGLYTLYLPCRYPGYNKAHEDLGRENIVSVAARQASGKAWANPEWLATAARATGNEQNPGWLTTAARATGGEQQPLVR